MSIAKRLDELRLILPPSPTSAAHYAPWILNHKTVYLAGQTSKDGTGRKYKGQLGTDLSADQGYEAARLGALCSLSVLHAAADGLESVERILRLTVFVNQGREFSEHPHVANGASELLFEVFGSAGVHVQCAVGANSLPGNAAVEVEMIAQVS